MEYVVDKKWKWVECNLVIKRLPQKQYQEGVYESLQAEVELISQDSDIKNFDSDIIMQKSFEFQEGKGFIWHKSWYIPEIIIKLSTKITRMLKEENHIKKIYCEMLSGYPFKKDEHFYLEQVRLDGETLRQFNKKGQVVFSNIKFSETSFNKNKNKFSIILVIYTSYKQNERSIIKSYISSPIHVDSRKEARKKISANTFIQDQIDIKKFTNRLEGSQKLINQQNLYEQLLSIPGFIKYYTAANIRFKIKHPYYIGYHFRNVFDVFYNSEEAKDPVDVLEIIYQNQVKENDKAKLKPKEKKELFTDNKEILKKASPKILLFLIKNTPKECLLIKDEAAQSQQKFGLSSQRNFAQQNEYKQRGEQKSAQNLELKRIVGGKVGQIEDSINQQNLINSGLSHILQPLLRKKVQNVVIIGDKEQIVQSEKVQLQKEQKDKIIKEQDVSEFGPEFASKNGELEANENTAKQQRRDELFKEEEAIKKIYSIFQSWKFNFIHLKKSDGGLTVINKKWVPISPEELIQSFKTYTKRKASRSNENNRTGKEDGGHLNGTNTNNYLSYQIHQMIVLQKSKNTVKTEEAHINV